MLVGSDTSDLDVHWALFNNFSRAFHFGESFGIKPSSALDKGCVRTQTTSPTWNIVAGHNILFLFGLGSCNILLYQIDGLSDIPRRGGQRYYGQAVVAKAQWSFQFPS